MRIEGERITPGVNLRVGGLGSRWIPDLEGQAPVGASGVAHDSTAHPDRKGTARERIKFHIPGIPRRCGTLTRVGASVAWIHVAPIKALAVQELQRVELGPLGVENDRRFCIVDPEGRMLNAKRVQRFVTIRPRFEDDSRQLVLDMPDGPTKGPIDLGEKIMVTISSRSVPAHVVDGPWSEALSAVAERPVQLVRFDDPGEGVDRAGAGGGASLLSQESLRAIADAAGVTDPVDPRRFRMLFGIAGVEAHAEDSWIGCRVHIGASVIVPGGNIGRCAVTTLDPRSGVPTLDTLAAIGKYRGEKVTTEPLAFGVWARVANAGTVRVGDAVHVS